MALTSDRHLGEALPKIVEELQGLTISLVTGAGANAEVAVESMEAEDTIAKIINMTDLTEMDLANVSIGDRRASGTLTVLDTLESGDVIVVNGKTYTFTEMYESITTNVGPNIIPFAANPSGPDDVATIAARLAKVLMSSDSALYATVVDNVVTVIWRVVGTVGNAKTLVVSGANGHVTRSGATLTGGAATNGFQSTDSTSGKKLLVFWYNKNRP
jgi:Mu-like prophage tail sheath protein gpL